MIRSNAAAPLSRSLLARLLAVGAACGALLLACGPEEEDPSRPRLVVTVTPASLDGVTTTEAEVYVTALSTEAAPGTGEVVVSTLSGGTFAGGAPQESLALQDGAALTTFRCVIAEDPACAGQVRIRAEWNDVRSSATVSLPAGDGGVPPWNGGGGSGGGGSGGGGSGGGSAQLVMVGGVSDTGVGGWAGMNTPGNVSGTLGGSSTWVATLQGAPIYMHNGGLFAAVSDPWGFPIENQRMNDTRRAVTPACGTGESLIDAVPRETGFAHGCAATGATTQTWHLGTASVTFPNSYRMLAGSGTTALLWHSGSQALHLVSPGGSPTAVQWPPEVTGQTALHWATSSGFRAVVFVTEPEGSVPTEAQITPTGEVLLGESYAATLPEGESLASSLDGSGNIFNIVRTGTGIIFVRRSPGSAEATTVYTAPACKTNLSIPVACLDYGSVRLLQKR